MEPKLIKEKIAMSWAYSPSYGKPLSVPQGVVGLMTRFGMDVALAHPAGYEIMPEVEAVAVKNAQASGGTFHKTNSMAEAFENADIVHPKSWAPFAAMILLARFDGPAAKLFHRLQEGRMRVW